MLLNGSFDIINNNDTSLFHLPIFFAFGTPSLNPRCAMREFNQIVPFYTWSSIILLPLTTMRCDSTSLSCYPSSHRHSVVSNPSIYSSCFASFKAIISCGIQFDHPSCSPWVTEMKNSASYPDVLAGQGSLSYAMLKAQYLLSGYHKIVAVHPQIRTLINLLKGPGLWSIAFQ